MKYGPGRGAIFNCPLCPLYKSFATAGLDPSIHLQKQGPVECLAVARELQALGPSWAYCTDNRCEV